MQLAVKLGPGGFQRVAHGLQVLHAGAVGMLLQPQALAQDFLHRVEHRILLVASNRLDFFTGSAQPGFQGIGGIQQFTDSALAAAARRAQAPEQSPKQSPKQEQGAQCEDGEDGGQDGMHASSLRQREDSGKPMRFAWMQPSMSQPLRGLTRKGQSRNILRLMSHTVPDVLDAWRMVAARREFEGRIPLAAMTRLGSSLVDTEGEVRFRLAFGIDALRVSYVELGIDAELPMECQSSLKRFLLPVRISQRLGLIRDEADEAALPEEYEALLVDADAMLRPAELVEDELILALPVVAVAPDAEVVERDFAPTTEETAKANPFAALAGLKKD